MAPTVVFPANEIAFAEAPLAHSWEMRRNGTIINWNDEKGFGFIAPDDRTADVFLHFRALTNRARRPRVGDLVQYDLDGNDERGPRAARVLLGAPLTGPASLPERTRTLCRLRPAARPATQPGRFFLILAVPVAVLGALALAAQRGFVPPWVAVLYIGMSAATAVAYALDKYRARAGQWRISEGTLQLLAMAGGWPGAFPAQRLLRHKTSKVPFQITFGIIVAAHLAFWSWFATGRP